MELYSRPLRARLLKSARVEIEITVTGGSLLLAERLNGLAVPLLSALRKNHLPG